MSTDALTQTMRSRILRGLAWKVFSSGFRQLSKIAVAVILARLLTPHDYGVAAMALVFSALVIIFADLALGAALVQRRELSERDRSTVFWTSTAIGLAFTLGGVVLSGPLAAFYGEPEVQPLFAALSVSFLVTALSTTQTALLTRTMDFRSLELRMMAGTVAGGAVGIYMAATGYGAWAIIAQHLAMATVSTALLWAFSPWRPRFVFSLASLRDLGGFSLNVFWTRVIFYLNNNADNILIGRFLGSAALGIYAVAYNVMIAPLSRIMAPIVEVFTPAFARMQDDPARIGSVWLRALRLVATIMVPGMLGLILVAPEFVHIVLTDRWAEAVPVIQILAWVGLLQSMQRFNSSVLQSRDRTRTLLFCSIVTVVASLCAFGIGLQWGIVGVATAYAVSSTFAEPYYAWRTMRTVGVSVRTYLANLVGVIEAALGMVVCVLGTRVFLLPEDMPAALRLAILVVVGAAAYLPLWAWRAPEVVADVRGQLRRRRKKAPPLTPATAEST
jgi:O-antigen/teichoic acid export membrane protein